jgi:hypothetical protein
MNTIKTPLRNAMLARGERLAEFLNYEEADADELLEQLLTLQGMLDRIIEKGQYIVRQPVDATDADRDTGLWCGWGVDKKVAPLLVAANRQLVKYGWTILEMVKLTRRGPPTLPLRLKHPRRFGSGQPFGDMLRDCLEDRALARVRRCPICKQWFMAGRTDQQHCSKRCRNQCGVRSNPVKWRAYMRIRRRLDKIRSQLGLLPARSSERENLNAEYTSLLRKKENLKGDHHAKK